MDGLTIAVSLRLTLLVQLMVQLANILAMVSLMTCMDGNCCLRLKRPHTNNNHAGVSASFGDINSVLTKLDRDSGGAD